MASTVDNNDTFIDYTARGLASEALQAVRSNEKLFSLQVKNMEQQHDELKELLVATNTKIDEMAKLYSNRFWSLAMTIIVLLMGALGTVCWEFMRSLQHG